MMDLQKRLVAVRGGDKAAFEALYEEMKRPLFTLILRITRDKALAEDILQELFLKLYLSPPEPSVNPGAYLCRMARNLAIDALRKQKPQADWEQAEATLCCYMDDNIDVEDAMAALPLRERQIVTLHINGGLKFREIAAMLEIPLGTALWAYQKALDQLRITLGDAI